MKRGGTKQTAAVAAALLQLGTLVCLLAVTAVSSLAQGSVEDRIAALESRIRQLENELAASKAPAQPVAVEPVAADGGSLRPFIRPAVLVSSSPSLSLPAEEMAEPAAPVPPQQAPATADIATSPDFEGLSFFRGVRFDGLLDAYYGYNFNKPASRRVDYRNFDFASNSATLNLLEINMSKPVSESTPLGYKLSFAYGPTADFVNGNDLGGGNITGANLLQYYVSGRIPGTKGLTLDVGKFVTQHGAEVIETPANWNYSRSILFAYAIPFYHFGIRATYPASDKVTLAAYLVNGWNNVVDNNGSKTGGFQLVWNPSSRFSFVQNYMVGPEQTDDNDHVRHLWDSLLTAKLDPNGKATFMVNFDYGLDHLTDSGDSVHWIGFAGYLRLSPSSWFSLTPRFEWFNDPAGFTTGTRQQLKEITITPEFALGEHFITRLEYRRDWSNSPTFFRGDRLVPGASQDTGAVGIILKF